MPEIRRFSEDMNYWQVPSRFPMHTAYVEASIRGHYDIIV